MNAWEQLPTLCWRESLSQLRQREDDAVGPDAQLRRSTAEEERGAEEGAR